METDEREKEKQLYREGKLAGEPAFDWRGKKEMKKERLFSNAARPAAKYARQRKDIVINAPIALSN